MNLASVVTQLETVTEFAGRIATAADLQGAIAVLAPMASPSCVLFAPRETGGKQELMAGGYRQQVTAIFGVLICTRYAGDTSQGAAYAALDTLRSTDVLPAMLGFKPTGADIGCTLTSGKLAYSEPGMLLWLDEFSTSYTLTKI